ncbi:MAG: DUF1501 domain-containing protein [Planctomycetia bacterium]|nr:DUF1501 domain-containing protein [Planctomycetia bacterium]
MFEVDNRPTQTCESLSRRSLLQVGSLGLFGLSLPKLLAAEQAQSRTALRDVNFILLWTNGGMSNIDTLDMKPQAPVEYRGEFKTIATDLPGISVCEHLPLMSRQMSKVCQVRSIVHQGSQHSEATHWMLTGYPQVPDVNGAPVGSTIYPCFGSVVTKELGWKNGMPPYVQCASESMMYSGGGYLGSAYNPLMVRRSPHEKDFTVDDVSIPSQVGNERTQRRRRILDRLDTWQRQIDRSAGAVADRGVFYRQAYDLITSPTAKRAFDLNAEPDALRDRYGRTREGQATLLARRLVESGVRFVAVDFSGYDTHAKNFTTLKDKLLPTLDRAWSALLADLSERGMLSNTVVLCAGEFGRTPRINAAAGRDHWSLSNTIGFSGAGIRMGEVVGATDAKCEQVVGRRHSTLDYAATIFRLMGIDDSQEYISNDGRPIQINNGGSAIAEALT